MEYATHNVIASSMFGPNGQAADDTYSDILMASSGANDCTYNNIHGNVLNSSFINKCKYGIREDDASQDYNLVHGNIVQGAVTANISLQGANSVSADNIV